MEEPVELSAKGRKIMYVVLAVAVIWLIGIAIWAQANPRAVTCNIGGCYYTNDPLTVPPTTAGP